MSKRKCSTGFLIVVAVILIGVAYLIGPALMRSRRSALAVVCMSNLRQIGLGCAMYTMDHDERYPNSLTELYESGHVELQYFFCPGHYSGHSPKSMKAFDEARVSYTFTPGLTTSDDVGTVVACDKSVWNHGGAGKNVLFADGHVSWMNADKIVKKDFEKIAEGLTAFFTDKGKYPTNQQRLEILVTSNYLKNLPADPFDADGKRPYGYATKNVENNWILTCYGPDNDRDIDLEVYSQGKLPTERLLRLRTKLVFGMLIVERTNGDIFRVGP